MSIFEKEQALLLRVREGHRDFDLAFCEELLYKLLELFLDDRIFASGYKGAQSSPFGSYLGEFPKEICGYLSREIMLRDEKWWAANLAEFDLSETLTFGAFFRFYVKTARFVFGKKSKGGWSVFWRNAKPIFKEYLRRRRKK